VTETGFHPSRIATRPTRFLGRLLTAGVWFRSALADCLDQGFKPAPVLFDAPLFGGLPFLPEAGRSGNVRVGSTAPVWVRPFNVGFQV
jgi:hypothetical protein